MTGNDSLTPKQRKAIICLLSEPTQQRAAKSAGIAEKTLYRWLQDDRFKTALAEAEAEAINAAIRHLVRMQEPAAAVIAITLKGDDVSPSVRLRAAMAVFDLLIKLKSFSDLEERVKRMEELIYEFQRTTGPY